MVRKIMPYPMAKKEFKTMEWTCCVCEHQVDERYFDTEERMCDECMNLAYPDGLKETHPGDDKDVQLAASIVKSNDKVSGVFMVGGKIEQIDYEPTTADEYNADYIKERLENSKTKKDKQNGS